MWLLRNSGPLEEWPVLLTAEPSIHPQKQSLKPSNNQEVDYLSANAGLLVQDPVPEKPD